MIYLHRASITSSKRIEPVSPIFGATDLIFSFSIQRSRFTNKSGVTSVPFFISKFIPSPQNRPAVEPLCISLGHIFTVNLPRFPGSHLFLPKFSKVVFLAVVLIAEDLPLLQKPVNHLPVR